MDATSHGWLISYNVLYGVYALGSYQYVANLFWKDNVVI